MTLKEDTLWYKFEGPSCYGNRVVYSFHSAMVWNAYHALQWYEMHTSANFEKVKDTSNFSQINKFFVVIDSVD